MPYASIRFYAELNDFLPSGRKQVRFTREFLPPLAIKDFIESAGVPHPEVDLILVNGEAVGFGYRLQDGDQVNVYPQFTALPVPAALRLMPPELDPPRFILDTHLGRLAAYLRMVGFDTLYRNDYDDDELARISAEDDRIVLTRDIGVLKRSIVQRGYFVRETEVTQQLAEIAQRFRLYPRLLPFTRCARCNSILVDVSKEEIAHRLELETRKHYDDFRWCATCDQIYWRGSHVQRLEEVVSMLGRADGRDER